MLTLTRLIIAKCYFISLLVALNSRKSINTTLPSGGVASTNSRSGMQLNQKRSTLGLRVPGPAHSIVQVVTEWVASSRVFRFGPAS